MSRPPNMIPAIARQHIIALLLLSILSALLLPSCSRYLDRAGSFIDWAPFQARMDAYKDSNVVTFRSRMAFHADTEVWHARPFTTALPKGLKSYDFDYGDTFVFYYGSDQVIAIWVDIQHMPTRPDSAYVPSEEEISSFIPRHLTTSGHKYNIQYIPYHSDRKQFMIRKAGRTILLYNIKEKNFSGFLKDVQTFTFL